jgi:hypothetical protein
MAVARTAANMVAASDTKTDELVSKVAQCIQKLTLDTASTINAGQIFG